jgi:hypothetical protein
MNRCVINFHGDIAPEWSFNAPFRKKLRGSCAVVECFPMTAIVSTYVLEQGFVIGSDGLRIDANSQHPITNQAKKIFLIEADGVRLAYGWAGATRLLFGDGTHFDFIDESAKIADLMLVNRPESIEAFTDNFALEMCRQLRLRISLDGRLSENASALPKKEIAKVLFVGYYNGKPYRTGASFLHTASYLQAPYRHEIIEAPTRDFNIFNGSADTWEEFKTFAAQPESLEEASTLIRKYIQACIDNQDKYEDCKGIGGHIHIMSLTPEKFTQMG